MRSATQDYYVLTGLNYDNGTVLYSLKLTAEYTDEILNQILEVDANGYPYVAYQNQNQWFVIAKFLTDLSGVDWAVTYTGMTGIIKTIIYDRTFGRMLAGGNIYSSSTNILYFLEISSYNSYTPYLMELRNVNNGWLTVDMASFGGASINYLYSFFYQVFGCVSASKAAYRRDVLGYFAKDNYFS